MTPSRGTTTTAGLAAAIAADVAVDRTSSTLLDRVRDWHDEPAWNAFFDRYDPLLRSWCHRDGLVGDPADELCQRIWIELMARMQSFRYDPSRGFRNWLWRLFRSRAVDLLRHRQRTQVRPLDGVSLEGSLLILPARAPDDALADEDRECAAASLLHLANQVQAAVRARVDAATWRAFEMIAIEDRPVAEVARELGKKYTAVYNGYRRVDKMLRQEGERCFAHRSAGCAPIVEND
jgi:RNA polymerase sigma factor (sigma-70 family)